MKQLFLLDGMALIYRAHFALIQSPIRNSKGINTSAIHGFSQTVLSILEQESVTHLGVAFDTSVPTFRHERYPAYKAQRQEMPEELAAAIPHVKRLCRAACIPVFEVDGFEADDIIGTLVKRAELEGIESYMVTPDKDFAQLISAKTFMWKPGRKGSEHEVIDLTLMQKNWEVKRADQVIDILGLMGDASDNIPGVPGIGEKTAKKLISEFDTIENLIEKSDQLKGKLKENVQQYSEQALLSKSLATIKLDVPLSISWEELAITQGDEATMQELFEEFELRSTSKRWMEYQKRRFHVQAQDANQSVADISTQEHQYIILDTQAKQADFFEQLRNQNRFCFDVETTSLNHFEAELLGIAFSWQAHQAYYLPIYDWHLQKEWVQEILNLPVEKIGHHLRYDLSILHRHGVQVQGPFFDTMIADTIIAPERRHQMDYLAATLLHYKTITLQDLVAANTLQQDDDLFSLVEKSGKTNKINMRSIPLEKLAEYAAEDADVTFQLSEKLRHLLEEQQMMLLFQEIEAPLIAALVRMEMEGIALDTQALLEISKDLEQKITQLEREIYQQAGCTFLVSSPKQLGEVLFDKMQLAAKAKKTKTGQFKTDEATLSSLEGVHPIIDFILEWRECSKLKSTYVDALPQHLEPSTQRVHTQFLQLVTSTGRLASVSPNLQNIPIRTEAGRQIRKAFVPRDSSYTMLSCDYSQIELRVMAALSNDQTMIQAFQQNIDIHQVTAAKVHGVPLSEVSPEMRRVAKMVNFGIIYGISAFGLSQRLGISRSQAADIIETYFKEYPAIQAFMESTVDQARKQGYAETLLGRKKSYPDLYSSNQTIRQNAERAAINMPIQGTAADMIKLAMIAIDKHLIQHQYRTKMLLQVHDELVFDLCLKEKEKVVPEILNLMKHALDLPNQVPIEVEFGIGNNWLEAH